GISEIPMLLDSAGLEFIDVVPRFCYEWQIQNTIDTSNLNFYEIYNQLPRINQLRIIELLSPNRQPENLFWCCNKNDLRYLDVQLQSNEDWLNAFWQVNPLFENHAVLDIEFTLAAWLNSFDERGSDSQEVHISWAAFIDGSCHLNNHSIFDILVHARFQPISGAEIFQRSNLRREIEDFVTLMNRFESLRILLHC
ncbi:MAG: hypothetical protein AAGB19_22275, partial [Cyanobacteria bacterium P01_F01_bin.3]